MGGIWVDIDSARYAADRLWHPSMSFDMMARDWAGFTLPLTVRAATRSDGPTQDTWNNWFTFEFFLPPDWSADPTFDDLTIHISIDLSLKLSVLGSGDVKVRITDQTSVTVDDNSFAWFTLTKTITDANWVSGQQTIQFQHNAVGAVPPNIVLDDQTEADGPRSFYQVRQA